MTLPAANATIKFSQLQSEYGGSNPISLSEYYRSPNTSNAKYVNYSKTNTALSRTWSAFTNLPHVAGIRQLRIRLSSDYASGSLIEWIWGGVVVSNAAGTSHPSQFQSGAAGIAVVWGTAGGYQQKLFVEGSNYPANPQTSSSWPAGKNTAGGNDYSYYVLWAEKIYATSTTAVNSSVPITVGTAISMSDFASGSN